jgi:hypothetical protein
MTRDDIIRMAREAGFVRVVATHADGSSTTTTVAPIEELERFAALVAAAEREQCERLCDDLERKKWETITTGGELTGVSARDCAAAIRARGE